MIRKDIDFSFLPNPLNGDLSVKKKDNATKQALKNIVLSEFYKRGFNIEVGCGIKLFNLTSNLEVQTIRDKISRAIKNFDPTTTIDSISVRFDEGENTLELEVYYYEQNSIDIKRILLAV